MDDPSSSDPATSGLRDVGLRPHVGAGTANPRFSTEGIDSRARIALMLGVFSLVFGALTGVPALWVGRQALIHIRDAEGDLRGNWAAWTGIVLGCLGVALTLVVVALLI